MNHIMSFGSLIGLMAVCAMPTALARPIDNLAAECQRTGAVSLEVKNATTGEKFIYWCGTRQLDPCPGNVCQPGEHIEVEPDCDAYPWDQGCTGDRFPDCPGSQHWDPARNRCALACGRNQVETYKNGRWTCEALPGNTTPGGSAGGGGQTTKPKTCLEAADKHCQAWFSVANLKDVSGECYTPDECFRKIRAAERAEMRTPTAMCELCINNSCKDLADAKNFPAGQYCTTSLGIATGRLADFWKRAAEIRDRPIREAEKRAECLRDPDLCGGRPPREP